MGLMLKIFTVNQSLSWDGCIDCSGGNWICWIWILKPGYTWCGLEPEAVAAGMDAILFFNKLPFW